MAKRAKTKRSISGPDQELRRWCIEQAIRWPLIGSPYQQAVAGIPGMGGLGQTEANIIDRANRILAWVQQ